MTTRLADATPGSALQGFMEQHKCLSLLVAPLSVQNQILGVALAIEGRQQRRFTRDEILMAESLMSQIASAIRQAKLYEDVRELENLKSEMIRMASHDLRNPLGSAMGYFEMLAPQVIRTLNETQQEYVGHIRRSLNTIKSLLEDLLTLDRIESERQTAWVELDFNSLAQQVVDGQMAAARLKQHEITVENPEGTLTIVGSATQLRQAVTNLVSNAIKYTPDNGKIQVRFKVADKRLTFEVQDNGYGISKERQSRLFQRFYRARQPGTDHIAGTGLGLSLVKTVIERHGGEVWVESEPGQGSTFGFWLPFKAQKSTS
jgi:signal transduction histidine kinase